MPDTVNKAKNVVEHLPVAVFRLSLSGKILHASRAFWHLLGHTSPTEPPSMTFQDILAPTQDEVSLKSLQASKTTLIDKRTSFQRADGTNVDVLLSLNSVSDKLGRVRFYDGHCEQISRDPTGSELLPHIKENIARSSKRPFFRTLVQYLTRQLKVDYAFIGELQPGAEESIRTIAVHDRGKTPANFEYRLKNTPCEDVVAKGLCIFPENVRKLFPQDHLLEEIGAESYIGTPLWDSRGNTMGVLAMVDRKPLQQPKRLKAVMQYYSERAAAEMERLRQDEELSRSISLLTATLDATVDGILVVDLAGKIVSYNERFAQMWQIPQEVLSSLKDDDALEFVLDELKHPEQFLKKVQELYCNPEAKSFDTIEFKDGRVFERYSRPQSVGDAITGRVWSFRDVTEHRQAQQELKHSEVRYRELIQWSPQAMGVFTDGRWTFINPAAVNLLGANTPEDLIGHSVMNLIHPDDREVTLRDIEDLFTPNKPQNPREIRLQTLDGREVYVEVMARPIHFDGKPAVQAVAQDITGRKQVQEELLASQKALSNLMRNLPGMAYRCRNDSDWTMEFVSEGCKALTGYNSEDILQNATISYADLIHRDDRQAVWDDVQAALKKREPFQLTYRIRASDGSEKWVWEQGLGDFSSSDKLLALEGFITDITPQIQAEEAKQESDRQVRSLHEHTREGIFRTTPDGVFLYANQALATMLGYKDVSEVLTVNAFSLYPDDKLRHEVLSLSEERGYVKDLEFDLCRKDGSIIRVRENSTALRDDNGEIKWFEGFLSDITEQRRAEISLGESEEKFRTLAEESPNMIFINRGGRVVYANRKCEEMMGYSREEFYADDFDFLALIDPQYAEPVMQNLKSHLSGIDVEPYEYQLITKDGRTITGIHTTKLINYGGDLAILGIITDITQRKKSEEALRESQEYLTTLTNSVADAILMISGPGRTIDYANRAVVDVLGYTPEEIRGKSTRILYKDDEAYLNFGVLLDEALKNNDLFLRSEREFRTKAGATIIAEVDTTIIQQKKQIWRTISVIRDISSRKQAEQVQATIYRISEAVNTTPNLSELYRSIHLILGELIPADNFYIALYDKVTDTISFPYDKDQYDETPVPKKPGKGLTEYVLRKKKPLLVSGKIFDKLLAKGEIELIGTRPVDWLGVPLSIRGQIIGVMAVQSYSKGVRFDEDEKELLIFVSSQVAMAIDRKRAEEERTRLALAVKYAAESIYITDRDGILQYINPAFEQITGYSRSELLGKNIRLLKSGKHDTEFYREMWDSLQAGNVWVGMFINRRKDGTLYQEDCCISPIRDDRGEIANYVGVARDVTQELAIEDQLRQSQKMESLGHLSGGIAHDFNNVLALISGAAERLNQQSRNDQERRYLTMILGAVERGQNVTARMLSFTRHEKPEFKTVSLLAIMKDIQEIGSHALQKNVTIEVQGDSAQDLVLGDKGQLNQVLLNLCVNAADAMPNGGRIAISLTAAQPELVERHISEPDKEYLCLTVADTGVGMDQHTLEHIFDPFFTTKMPGKGTGLGLSIIYQIVQAHHGWIEVESVPGEGTTFSIGLPVSSEKQAAISAESLAAVPAGKGEHILIVDDEPGLRALLEDILSDQNYTITLADDGEAAWDLYQKHGENYDLIITDLGMPKMGGKELVKHLHNFNSKVKIIITSGFVDAAEFETLHTYGVEAILTKPFKLDEVLQTVSRVLGRSGEESDT